MQRQGIGCVWVAERPTDERARGAGIPGARISTGEALIAVARSGAAGNRVVVKGLASCNGTGRRGLPRRRHRGRRFMLLRPANWLQTLSPGVRLLPVFQYITFRDGDGGVTSLLSGPRVRALA